MTSSLFSRTPLRAEGGLYTAPPGLPPSPLPLSLGWYSSQVRPSPYTAPRACQPPLIPRLAQHPGLPRHMYCPAPYSVKICLTPAPVLPHLCTLGNTASRSAPYSCLYCLTPVPWVTQCLGLPHTLSRAASSPHRRLWPRTEAGPLAWEGEGGWRGARGQSGVYGPEQKQVPWLGVEGAGGRGG